mgnify:CR=1 FL=1
MKKILLFFIFVFIIQINSQLILGQRGYSCEMYLFSSNGDSSGYTDFILEAESQIWNSCSSCGGHDHPCTLTNDFRYILFASENSKNGQYALGLDFVTDTTGHQVFAYGKYKLTVENWYIYLDFRDNRYGYYDHYGSPVGHAVDIWIMFDHLSRKFYINSVGYQPPWTLVPNGTVVNIWELKEMGNPSTTNFEPYAPENLSVSLSNGKLNYSLFSKQ